MAACLDNILDPQRNFEPILLNTKNALEEEISTDMNSP